jgi:hypothetical protein
LDAYAGGGLVYKLDSLADREFVFKYEATSRIESVAVRHLRLSLTTGSKRHVSVQADPTQDPKAIYDLLDGLDLPPF